MWEGIYNMYVPALRLPPVGLLAEEKAKEDPPVPTPPNPGPPPKPVGERWHGVSLGWALQATLGMSTRSSASGVQAGISKHVCNTNATASTMSLIHSFSSDRRLQNKTVFTVRYIAKQRPKGQKQHEKGFTKHTNYKRAHRLSVRSDHVLPHCQVSLNRLLGPWGFASWHLKHDFNYKTDTFLGQISPPIIQLVTCKSTMICGTWLLSFLVVWTHKEEQKTAN